jgi:hypothetical protein
VSAEFLSGIIGAFPFIRGRRQLLERNTKVADNPPSSVERLLA